MIKTAKGNHEYCISCGGGKEVHELTFRKSKSGVSVTICVCKKCMEELRKIADEVLEEKA